MLFVSLLLLMMIFDCLTGNDQMKMENFSAAVDFYSKAITVNPHNAVYFCNRSVLFISSFIISLSVCSELLSGY